MPDKKPNILFIISDQERHRDWLPEAVRLPNRQRLIDEGIEFTQYYTHSSPCSPSRAIAVDRAVRRRSTASSTTWSCPSTPSSTRGPHHRLDALRDEGYRTQLHRQVAPRSQAVTPDMTAYGFADWEGNDRHFMGWAGTGVQFDPIDRANTAADWLRAQRRRRSTSRGS